MERLERLAEELAQLRAHADRLQVDVLDFAVGVFELKVCTDGARLRVNDLRGECLSFGHTAHQAHAALQERRRPR
jgi:hypothetical protein